MKKYITILLLLVSTFAFGQLIRSDQINTDPFKLDSTYFGNVPAYISPSGKTIVAVGTSITNNTGVSPSINSYLNQTGLLTGYAVSNLGRNGTTLGNPAVASSLVTTLSTIPSKTSSTPWLIFEYVVNDVEKSFSYSSVTYATDYQTCINYALSHGWSTSNIIMCTSWYIDVAANKQTMTTTQFQARIDSFNTAVRTVATTNSIKVCDWYPVQKAAGGTYLSADGTHPNNYGSAMMARVLADAIFPTVTKKGQAQATNGTGDFNVIRLNNYTQNSDTSSSLVNRDSLGFFHTTSLLPHNIHFYDNIFLPGQIRQMGATAPNAGYGVHDIGLYQDAVIWGVFNGNGGFASSFKPINAFGSMTFTDTYSLGTIDFLTNSTQAMRVAAGGYLIVGNLPSTLSPIAGDIWIPQGNAGLKSTVSTVTGAFNPLLSDDFTAIWNGYNAGGIHFYLANGTNGNKIEMMRLYQNGHLIFNPGGTYTDNPIALMQFAYNTGGIMYPRVTTAGRDSMAYVLGNPSITPGTGYSVAPTLAIAAPASGVTATATATVSGGLITGIVITNPGTGYYTVPAVTITPVSGGSGAAITLKINMTNQKGLVIYNSTNSRIESYNGTNWLGSPGNLATSDNSHYIAGDGSYNTIGSKPHTIFTPTTGGTVALVNNQYNIINPSGALLALTVNLPSSPVNNDCVYIKFTQNVTTVTYGNGTVVDGITAPTAGGLTVLTYDSGTTSWY